MATKLRSQQDPAVSRGSVTRTDDARTLGQMVTAAASAAPTRPAIVRPGLTITFGQLASSALGAVSAMSGGTTIDDSALTVALMMNVPGLALSGPSGLAATLGALRVQASIALSDS